MNAPVAAQILKVIHQGAALVCPSHRSVYSNRLTARGQHPTRPAYVSALLSEGRRWLNVQLDRVCSSEKNSMQFYGHYLLLQ